MTVDWRKARLVEIANVSTGPFGSLLHKSDYVEHGLPLVNPINISDEEIVPDPKKLIGEEARTRLDGYILRGGDIVVARRGEIGRCAVVTTKEDGWVCGTGCFFIRPSSGVSAQFLARLLRSERYRDQLEKASSGTTMLNLSNQALGDLAIELPDLREQQRIVGILDEAFAGIAAAKAHAEQNRRNARGVFDSHLQSVFQERGNGWVVKPMGEVCEVKDGTHDSPKYVEDGIPFVTQKNIREDGLSLENTKFIRKEDHDDFYRRSNVEYGDILISMIGANRGMACVVNDARTFSIKNVGLVKRNLSVNHPFLLYYLKSPQAASIVQSASKGGAQEFIGLTELRRFPVPLPPLERQNCLAEQFESLREETQHLDFLYTRKLAALDELKKSLLQRAFSGEL